MLSIHRNLVAISTFSLLLAACGGDNTSSNNQTTAQKTEQVQEQEPNPVPTQEQAQEESEQYTQEQSQGQSQEQSQEQTKVFKYDGSLQCEHGETPIDDMRLDLAKAGIDVICTQKGYDGYMHASVCGGPTGNINVFVIYSSNVPDAEKLGFKSISELPDYQDKTCTN